MTDKQLVLLYVISVLWAVILPSDVQAASTVEMYSVFELTVENDEEGYLNPFDFDEIELKIFLESPSSRTIGFYGFYDGDGVWKIRFMPDEIGIWKYRYSWSDGTHGGEGEFAVKGPGNPQNHGHVQRDRDNPRYLIHDDGTPHYWWGSKWISALSYGPKIRATADKPTSAISRLWQSVARKKSDINPEYYSDEQLIDYLDTLVRYRHNGVLLKIALFPLKDDKISWNLPWIKRAEWLVRQMLDRGIYTQINIFDTWSREQGTWFTVATEGGQQVFDAWNSGDEKAKKNYIRTIIARFAGFANVYWELGNEMDHAPNSGANFVKLANKYYIPWIRQFDPYSLPIGLSEGIWKQTQVDVGFLHQADELPGKADGRPVIMNELVGGGVNGEALWKDSTIRDSKDRFSYRRTFWQVFTHGGSGSSEATWLDITRPLNDSVEQVMKDHMQFRQFIEQTPVSINKMNINHDFIIESPGQSSARTLPGAAYISYFKLNPDECVKAGTMKLLLPGGVYRIALLTPQDGNEEIETIHHPSGELFVAYPNFCEDLALGIFNASYY